MKFISEEWTSLRDKWPFQRGTYKVYDCEYDVEGKSDYNGINFLDVEWDNIRPLKGSLLLPHTNKISHWKK
jgi:hypothetical protein